MKPQPNICNNFRISGNSCRDAWTSLDGADLLIDIIETERQCERGNDTVCIKGEVDQIKKEEKMFWECLDHHCGKNSDKLVEGRKKFLDGLNDSFKKFTDGL